MTTIELSGLIGSNALGALASFGLLRVLSLGGAPAKLAFVERDDWIAVIECELGSLDELVTVLAGRMRERAVNDLTWTEEDIRVPPEEFRGAMHSALATDAHLVAFLSAFAADGAVDKSKGLIKPTRFFMASGQQSFLRVIRALQGRLKENGVGCGARLSRVRGRMACPSGLLAGIRAPSACTR